MICALYVQRRELFAFRSSLFLTVPHCSRCDGALAVCACFLGFGALDVRFPALSIASIANRCSMTFSHNADILRAYTHFARQIDANHYATYFAAHASAYANTYSHM